MPDFPTRREKTAATRTPPDWCRGHGFEKKFSIKRDECTPDAESEATLAKTQRLMAAGERLAEVVGLLESLEMRLRQNARVFAPVCTQAVELTNIECDELHNIILYAEHGE